MKALVIDITKCNGCYNCQIACKDEHVANDWNPYARPQPETGQFWMRINETTRGSVPKVKVIYEPRTCQHCDAAPCITACKEKAIYKRDDGIVMVDPGKCNGQKNCLAACPYGAIYFNEDLKLAQKCTMCAHLLDRGWKEPRCVEVCPTGALKFGEEKDLQDLIQKAELLKPESKTQPRVYYIGLPKRFIAGAVYDPRKDECIEGASITLIDSAGKSQTINTDNFGDFWFEGLKVGTYSVKVEAKGFATKNIDSISTEKDVNLGDIPLS
jgi:Fe-S-cluster-containing dehydrogenase component